LLDPLNITIGSTADVNGDTSIGDDVAGNIASGDFSGANIQITAAQVSSLLNGANLSLAATANITVAQAITKSSGSAQLLTLDAGNAININAAISGSPGSALGVNLIAGGNITVAAPIDTFGGDFTVTGSNAASTMLVSTTVSAATMGLTLAGDLSVLAGTTTAQLLAAGNQTISASGILLQAGAFGLNVRANIAAQSNQTITVGNGGLTLVGGGGAQSGNSANLTHDGGPGTSQSITINGTGFISEQGGSSALTGVGDGNGSHASIHSDNGDNQSITFTGGGAGRTITLTGGINGSDAFAEIYAGIGSQTINGAATITLTGGASGGGITDVGGNTRGNIAGIGSDLGSQTLNAEAIVLQGGAAGINNLAAFFAGGNQIFNVGAGGLSLTGGSGGVGEIKNAAVVIHTADTPLTSQTITVSGGDITLQGGTNSGTNVGSDANLSFLQNGATAIIRSDGVAQLFEFTTPGGRISLTGGSIGSNNVASIQASNGSQTVRGSILAHAPSINILGGSGGVAIEGNGAQIGANAGLQTISAKAVSLNGGSGVDSFATITAPNQVLNFDGNVGIAGGTGTGTSPGARIGGRGGAAGSNTNLNLTVTGNLSMSAGPSASGGLGSTSLATELTNDITATIGGTLTMTPSAGAGNRIGSRFDDVQAGTIAVTAGNMLFNVGDGANNVAGIRTLGNVTLNTTVGSIIEAADTNIRANLVTVSSAGAILMDSLANQVTSLNATVSGFDGGNIFFTNAPETLLNLTGITMSGSGNQTARITADDIDITGAVSNVGGMVMLRPLDLARDVHIETTPTVGVLSLSPIEMQQVTNATVLEIGRIDGTGNLILVSNLPNNNNVSTLRLLAGLDFLDNSGASIGDIVTPFNHHLLVRANRDLQINSGNVFLSNDRNLQLYADDDGIGGGVSIGSAILGVGTDASNSSGSMNVKGSAINVAVAGGASASLNVFGTGNQTFTATSGDLLLANNHAGSDAGFILLGAKSGTQSLNAFNLVKLQAGDGNTNSTTVSSDAGQAINAAQLQVVGGGSGSNSFAQISGGDQALTIGAGGIAVTGGSGTNNYAQIFQSGAAGAQSITSDGGIFVIAGSGTGGGNRAQVNSSGTGGQSVSLTTGGTINVTGGSAGFSNYAGINAQSENQSITGASSISISGGAAGGGFNVGNGANIGLGGGGSVGNQSVSVGSGGLLIQGGGGTGTEQDNSAFLSYGGSGTQTVTITGGDLMIIGGSSAKQGVGGSGHGSRAGIDAGTSTASQQFVVLDGGNITLTGGSNGSRNYAGILADSGSQTITGATNITLTAGANGGVAGEGNRAIFNAANNQLVSASNISLAGGSKGTENYARIGLFGTGALTQTIAASSSIALTGGADGGGFNTGNSARIQSDGNQTVVAGAGGIALSGGGGSLSDNRAHIYQGGTTGKTQSVQVTDGGSITLQGGSSAQTNVGGFGHGSFAAIEANGNTQLVDFVGGGSLTITGGTVGSRNLASVYAPNGNQTITGASTITLQGGASGGFDGEGNTASLYVTVGTQAIAGGNIQLTGGADGIENSALILGLGGQTINATGIALTGGAGGGGFSDGNRADIRSNAIQLINVQTGGIQLTGGSGLLSDNDAQIEQLGTTGSQTINVNSGSITIQGGSSAGTNVGGVNHGSRAQIYSEGMAQNIQFTGTAGTLSLTGGTAGSRNFASIYAKNTGSQTISGLSALTLTGGANGGFAGEGNVARIGATAGAQSITAGPTILSAGVSGIENSATITALSQSLTINGDLVLNGGGGSGGTRIGGQSSTGSTSLNLSVTGDLTLNGGAASWAAIESANSGIGLTNTIIINTTGAVMLAPSATQGVRIGSPAADLQGGSIFVVAGNSFSLSDGGGSAVAEIRSLGDVTLSANQLSLGGNVLGNTIFAEGNTGVSISGTGSLTASATTGASIEVIATSGSFSNTAGSGALNVSNPARWLVYSNDPALDTRGGLAYGFKQYNATLGDTILGAGNGFIYTVAPTATVSLTGIVNKVYDGTDTATLAAGNFIATGGIDGDGVSISAGASGIYDTRNVGSGKLVSVSGVTISALDGTTPVFGYGLWPAARQPARLAPSPPRH
jgi:hypothetical protein